MNIRDTSAQDIPRPSARGLGRHRRWLWPALIGALLLAALGWIGHGWLAAAHSVDAARLRIAEVRRGDLVRDIAAEGRVIASNSPSLYAIGAGTVTLHVVAGDAVSAEQVLAEIDSPELLSRLAQEEATLASLEAEATRAALHVRIARANAARQLDQARVDQTTAQREMERNQRAYARGAISQIDFARAEDAVQKAAIGLRHAREDARLQGQAAEQDASNRHALAERQRALVEELRRQVDALRVRAPFDGQVGQIFISQRQNVAANAALLSLVDLRRFEVEIKVPESFARDLAIGMPAELSGNNQRYPATVAAVSPEVVNGEVSARLRFAEDKQPEALRQNQRLAARILLDTRRDVLMVERGPALDQGVGHSVWVVTDGIATKRPVKTGARSLDAVEIVNGLAEGERVIVSGHDLLGDAENVRVRD